MFIKKAAYLALIEKHAREETRANWFMERVNQLERENADLRHRVLGIVQSVPQYQRTKDQPAPHDHDSELSFEDMGDTAALREGATWNKDGEVVYGK